MQYDASAKAQAVYSQGIAGVYACEPTSQTVLGATKQDMCRHFESLNSIANMLENLADRALGCEDAKPSPPSPAINAVPNGLTQELTSISLRTDGVISRLQCIAERLQKIA